MRRRSYFLTAGAVLAAALFHAGINPLRSQTPAPAALAGQVSSMEEGSMEGVLVSAKKAGSTITTTVVVIVEPAFFALTSTPSMEPSSMELTWPASAAGAGVWLLSGLIPA